MYSCTHVKVPQRGELRALLLRIIVIHDLRFVIRRALVFLFVRRDHELAQLGLHLLSDVTARGRSALRKARSERNEKGDNKISLERTRQGPRGVLIPLSHSTRWLGQSVVSVARRVG